MSNLTILAFRILVVVIVLGALATQIVFVPFIGYGLTDDAGVPELGLLYTVGGIAVVACVQVAFAGIWVLLSMVRRGAIFTDRAFRWVDLIIGAATVATVLMACLSVHVYFVIEPPLDAPGLLAMALGVTILGAAFVLLMFVMRGLLRSATNLQSELAEVV